MFGAVPGPYTATLKFALGAFMLLLAEVLSCHVSAPEATCINASPVLGWWFALPTSLRLDVHSIPGAVTDT